MPTLAKQLELDLWQHLKAAKDEPETADLEQLWQSLEQAIALVEREQQLQLAAEAIASIVEVYVERANTILASLELQDSSDGPVLGDDFLAGLMRQSMTIDVSDLMEELFPQQETITPAPSSSSGSVVTPVDKTVAKASADSARVRAEAEQQIKDLAEKEQVSQSTAAISQWMQQHNGKTVSLLQLQQALGMPLVDVWLGLLLSQQQQYDWEQRGDFYSDARGIWLSCGSCRAEVWEC